MNDVTVLVCGGRHYGDSERVREVLDQIASGVVGKKMRIVHGAATGADALAQIWAIDNKIEVKQYPANWKRWGRGAGPRRNAEMLADSQPSLCVAFPGGAGTEDMVKRCRAAGVMVVRVKPQMTPREVQRKQVSIKKNLDNWHNELKLLQQRCLHANVVKKYGSNTGNYDPSNDCEWNDYSCPDCGKRWTVMIDEG